MPIYEYRCEACGHQLEVLQKISDQRLTDCPSCQQPALKKMVSAAGFRLSGSGWYETDFKDSNKKNISGGSDVAKAESSNDKATSSETSNNRTNKD